MKTKPRKRNIVIDEGMWAEIHKACGRHTVATGEPISASEWIRRLIRREVYRSERVREFVRVTSSDS